MTFHNDLKEKKNQHEQKTLAHSFIKPDSHFVFVNDSAIPHEAYHHIYYFKKAPRQDGSGSDKRKHSRWQTVVNNTIKGDKNAQERLNNICVLVMRLFRLSNLISPKACIFNGMLMSQVIPQSEDFAKHYQRVIAVDSNLIQTDDYYSNYSFKKGDYEDLGRSVLDAYYLGQDDGRFENFLYWDQRVIAIDPDRCLGGVTLPFHNDAPRTVKSSLSLAEFEDLPLLSHKKQRMNWSWNEASEFSKFLIKSKKFKFGKHFNALKHVVLFHYEIAMTNADIDHVEDKKNIIQFLSSRNLELKQICKQSGQFNIFLGNERRTVIKIIFYELNQFERENRDRSQDALTAEAEWLIKTNQILANFEELLKLTDVEPLSKQEFKALRKYAIDVRNNKAYTLDEAKKFYDAHGMPKRAQEVTQFAEKLKLNAEEKKASGVPRTFDAAEKKTAEVVKGQPKGLVKSASCPALLSFFPRAASGPLIKSPVAPDELKKYRYR